MSYASVANKQTALQFDIRHFFGSFRKPNLNEILNAVKASYPDDGSVVIKEGLGRFMGIFTIYAQSTPPEPVIKLSRKRRGTEGSEVIEIPLNLPSQHRARTRDDLLITIVDADLGSNHDIPGRDFDSALGVFGSIEVGTQPQKYRGSSVGNGNRYCVIKKKEDTELPNRLEVSGKSFLIKYRGKKWFCQSCKEDHVGACPYLKELYDARDKRNNQVITHHIVSDSSLRLAEEAGIRADISVMSGATLGQLTNAVEDDDDTERHRNVVFAAGANDVKVDENENERQIARRVDASVNRLVELVTKEENLNRTFHIVSTCPYLNDMSKRQYIANEYYWQRLKKVCTTLDNLELIKIPQAVDGWEDNHPTEEYTKTILNQIMRVLQDDLLINEKVLTTKRLYRGVHSHFLSGCTGCNDFGLYEEGGFCASCVQKMSQQKKSHDEKLLKKVLGLAVEKFPSQVKRPLSDSDDGSSAKK